ncbi:hypothetical protein HKD37_17G048477 [Glycine soja]
MKKNMLIVLRRSILFRCLLPEMMFCSGLDHSLMKLDSWRSGRYRSRKKDIVRIDIGSRKCGFPFKLHGKPVVGEQGWMVKLMCGSHNHELTKLLVEHPYAGRLTKDEKTIIADMTSTYKRNRYKLRLLDFVGVTPTGMTFSAGFAYLEGERVNNMVWALERFQGLFLRRDALPGVIVTDRDLTLMNVVKTYVMDAWGSLDDCRSEHQFDDYLKKFEIALKRLLQNSLGDLCSVWDAMNNMITLQHTEIKASFETSTHVVGHVFKVTLYKRLLGMVSRVNSGKFPTLIKTLCPPPEKVNNKGMDEDSWSLVCNHLLKELSKWSDEYVNLFGGIDRFEELKRSLLVDGLSMVTMDKWMDITDMGYVIASRYNVILVSLSLQ